MEIVDLQAFTTPGSLNPEYMEDTLSYARADGGAYYLGVFDGHGSEGAEVAELCKSIVDLSAGDDLGESQSDKERSGTVKRYMKSVSSDVKNRHLRGGSTATVAVVNGAELSVVYLGDSEAYYYPDTGSPIALTGPHTPANQAEVERVNNEGFEVLKVLGVPRFAGRVMISRAIGDGHYPFMSDVADITERRLDSPGTLLIATDGIWGTAGTKNDCHDIVEKAIRKQRFNDRLVKRLAKRTQDHATAVIARIE